MGKPSLAEFQDYLQIDRNNLDGALLAQPDLFFRVSEQLTNAISERDEVKLKLERKLAELDVQMREEASQAEGGKRLTDKAIERELETTPVVVNLRKELSQLVRQVGQWSALKESFSQRSHVLRDLVQLYCANYFTTSSAKGAKTGMDVSEADRVRAEAGKERSERLRPQRR